MLRGREEGVVTRFLPGNQVEMEIEDGFRIPVLRSEIVVVSPMEALRFRNESVFEPQKPPTRPDIVANKGFYLAFVPQNDRDMAVHLVNNTDWELPFTIGEEKSNRFTGLQSGILKARTHLKLNQLYQTEKFEEWPTFVVQALWFRNGVATLRPPLVKRLKPRAQSFYKSKKLVPVLNNNGHLFQLDEENNDKPIEPQEIRTKMFEPNSEPETIAIERPSATVDLHVEALLPGGQGKRTSADLLELQLKTFEKSLENAIAAGMDDITFIHGVGNGVLRMELHRRLSKHAGVQFFQDAQKERFGYGATKVKLK